MRIYIDTSVVGGVFDDEFAEPTKKFFENADPSELIFVVSDLLRAELLRAPDRVQNYPTKLTDTKIEEVTCTDEALRLADLYISENVVGATSLVDCQHIATATVHKVDVLVSWNFKHIVNLKRILGYNSVNLKCGYPILEIRSPIEVLEI